MRVLLVNDLPPGPGSGVEVHLDRLRRGLAAAGDEVELFAGEIEHHGAAKLLDLWDPWARRALVRRAAAFRPDVVHHHNVVRELSSSVLGVPRGVRSVLTVHDHRLLGVADSSTWPARARAAKGGFDRAVARRRIDDVVAVSAPLRDALLAAGFRAVHLVAPFVDLVPEDGSRLGPADCSDVVAAGRLAADKGFDVLIEAFGRIAADHPDARLVIAGDGPERGRLAALAAPLGERVSLVGRLEVEAVVDLMASARVVVAPSLPALRPEGAGMTVLEAATVGRPVIVSDDPALVATASSAGEPVVVRAGSVDELAAAVRRLLGDPDLAAALGAEGRRQVGALSTERGVAALRAIYAGEAAGR